MPTKTSKKLKIGDIFYLQLRDQKKYIFGRLLFDVDKQYHKVVATKDVADDYFPYLLMSHNGCQLIEIYEGVYDTVDYIESKVLIPRVFARNIGGKFNILSWGIVGHRTVDYLQIEFPEHLNLTNNYIYLDRGEMSLKTTIAVSAAEKLGFKTNLFVPATIVDAALFLQNKSDMIPEEYRRPNYLTENDLYYHPTLRETIYAGLRLDPKKSYYKLAKDAGFDLARFYRP